MSGSSSPINGASTHLYPTYNHSQQDTSSTQIIDLFNDLSPEGQEWVLQQMVDYFGPETKVLNPSEQRQLRQLISERSILERMERIKARETEVFKNSQDVDQQVKKNRQEWKEFLLSYDKDREISRQNSEEHDQMMAKEKQRTAEEKQRTAEEKQRTLQQQQKLKEQQEQFFGSHYLYNVVQTARGIGQKVFEKIPPSTAAEKPNEHKADGSGGGGGHIYTCGLVGIGVLFFFLVVQIVVRPYFENSSFRE